jgi:hypothetical protein
LLGYNNRTPQLEELAVRRNEEEVLTLSDTAAADTAIEEDDEVRVQSKRSRKRKLSDADSGWDAADHAGGNSSSSSSSTCGNVDIFVGRTQEEKIQTRDERILKKAVEERKGFVRWYRKIVKQQVLQR